MFLESPAPRRVPPAIRERALGGGYRKGIAAGLTTGLVLAVVASISFPWGVFGDRALGRHGTVVAGEVTRVEETMAADARVQRQAVDPITAYGFSFSTAGGATRHGSCFCSRMARMETGQDVQVEYLEDDPALSRIRGCRRTLFRPWTAWVALLPIPMFSMALLFAWFRWRRLALLKHGAVTRGTVEDVGIGSSPIQLAEQYQVTVAFEVDGLPVEARYNAYGSQAEKARARQETGEEVDVIFDPGRPERAIVL